MKYWLMKTEPDVFSFDDLKKAPRQTTFWDGVRNYQARNFMRDEMKVGDLVLFYHSNCEEPAVVGVAKVTKEAAPDPSAFDPKSKYFDPKSKKDAPTWMAVEITFERDFKRPVTLAQLKARQDLQEMKVVQKGQRLSVQPVTPEEFKAVEKLGH